MVRKFLIASLVLGLMVISALTGCFEDLGSVTEEFNGEYNANENTTFEIDNINGNIIINVWTGDKVKLDAEKKVQERYKDEFKLVEINVTEALNVIIIKTIYQDENKKHVSVNMEILVPFYVYVDSVTTSNGNIDISDTLGNTSAESSNGGITIKNVVGYVTAHSSNGNLDIQGTSGIFDLDTSNGNINAEIFDINDEVSISSSNGNVVVYIVPTLNATIDMQTSNGDASVSGISLDKTLDQDKHVTGTLNGGGYKINIHSSNGDVELRKLDA